jgi:hypothetical protein
VASDEDVKPEGLTVEADEPKSSLSTDTERLLRSERGGSREVV